MQYRQWSEEWIILRSRQSFALIHLHYHSILSPPPFCINVWGWPIPRLDKVVKKSTGCRQLHILLICFKKSSLHIYSYRGRFLTSGENYRGGIIFGKSSDVWNDVSEADHWVSAKSAASVAGRWENLYQMAFEKSQPRIFEPKCDELKLFKPSSWMAYLSRTLHDSLQCTQITYLLNPSLHLQVTFKVKKKPAILLVFSVSKQS